MRKFNILHLKIVSSWPCKAVFFNRRFSFSLTWFKKKSYNQTSPKILNTRLDIKVCSKTKKSQMTKLNWPKTQLAEFRVLWVLIGGSKGLFTVKAKCYVNKRFLRYVWQHYFFRVKIIYNYNKSTYIHYIVLKLKLSSIVFVSYK